MKHKLKISLFLILIFILAQITGILVTASYKKNFYEEKEIPKLPPSINKTNETEEIQNISIAREFVPEKVEIKTTFDVVQIVTSFLVALVIATVVFIILMRIGVIKFMRIWLFIVVLIGLFISFSLLFMEIFRYNIKLGRFYFSFPEFLAIAFAFLLAYYKIYKQDFIVHNLTEIFIYPGIIILFLPLVNIIIVVILLLFISIYDFVAVFRTKHMQKMAKFMIKDVRVFAGIMLPYISEKEKERLIALQAKSKKSKKKIKIKVNLAVLGGGDIAFPMLLSSTVFLSYGLLNSIFIISFATLSLFALLMLGEKGKAYPALPPLAIGSLIGFLISLAL